MLAGGLLSVVINLAKAQVETCPNGYYLTTNNLCYPYQLPQVPHNLQDIQNCKIGKDAMDMDKALGANASVIGPLQRMYNVTCGTFMK